MQANNQPSRLDRSRVATIQRYCECDRQTFRNDVTYGA